MNQTTVSIASEYITLQQLLKLVGICGTGGAAKMFLQSNFVKINGEPENRRGRKIYPGDLMEWDQYTIYINLNTGGNLDL